MSEIQSQAIDIYVCIDSNSCETCPVADFDPKTRSVVSKLLHNNLEAFRSLSEVATETVNKALDHSGITDTSADVVTAVDAAARDVATGRCSRALFNVGF